MYAKNYALFSDIWELIIAIYLSFIFKRSEEAIIYVIQWYIYVWFWQQNNDNLAISLQDHIRLKYSNGTWKNFKHRIID